jgi:hypothetical protein
MILFYEMTLRLERNVHDTPKKAEEVITVYVLNLYFHSIFTCLNVTFLYFYIKTFGLFFTKITETIKKTVETIAMNSICVGIR